MEENTAELLDYFSVIWKRKILIIVVILVCTGVGVGVGVKNSMSKQLPASYSSTVSVKIGKKVSINLTSASLTPVVSPGFLEKTINLTYGEKVREAGYYLEAAEIAEISMIILSMKGPDKGVEIVLKEVVDMLIEEHRRKAKDNDLAYANFIQKLEVDARMIQRNITVMETIMIKMKNKEEKYLEYMDKNMEEAMPDKQIMDRSVIWNMLYLKTIDKEIDLNNSRQRLRDIQWQLLVHRTTIGSIDDYSTKMVGKMKSTVTKKKATSNINAITIAGVAGLILSLFIAFFWEYIEESKSRRKGKLQG